MMMFKRIHWLCIYAGTFFLFFTTLFINVRQKVILLAQKQIIEKNVLNAIDQNKKILSNITFSQQKSLLKIDNKLLETADILAYITHFFVAQNVVIDKVQLLKVKAVAGVNALPVKVSATGDFAALPKLIAALSASSLLVAINDFSLQIDRNGKMITEMQLLVFAVYVKALAVDFQTSRADDMGALMNTTSLKQIKWVGFLRDENTIFGLLMLPKGETVAVRAGSIIGVEKGKVMSVGEEGVMIDSRGEKIYLGVDKPRQLHAD